MSNKTKTDREKLDAEKQILKHRKPIDYDTLEYPVEVIVSKYDDEEPITGDWYIPNYQREYIWNDKLRSRFIESVLLNIPIPFMFLAETEDGRLEIVDGSQRIRTLHVFMHDQLRLRELTILTNLNGFVFSDLTDSEQRKFRQRGLRIIKLSDKADNVIRQDIFNRVNTNASRLVESEIRRGSFIGPFYQFIQDCSADERFLRLCPFSEQRTKRREPEEYLLRYFTYKERYLNFKHEVQTFLDKYVIEQNKSFTSADKAREQQEFKQMLAFAEKYLPYGFKRSSGANTSARVRFEALAVGITLALRKNPKVVPKNVNAWLESDDFRRWTTSDGSNSPRKLRGRIEFVRDSLLEKS